MSARTTRVTVDPKDLTPYAVALEGWITDGRGHSALRTPAAEGEAPNTVLLHPMQAEYLISSGHIKPIPGETKGYPADAVTGEALDLSHEDRKAIEAQPNIGSVEEGPAVEGQGKAPADDPGLASTVETTPVVLGNTSGDEAAQQDGAQEALASDATAAPVEGRASRRGR